MADFPLSIDDFSLALPETWQHETSVVSRGPAVDGHHPNIRLIHRVAPMEIPLAQLAQAYQDQLQRAAQVKMECVAQQSRSLGGIDGIEMVFVISPKPAERIIHRALVATHGRQAMTVICSYRDDPKMGELADQFMDQVHFQNPDTN